MALWPVRVLLIALLCAGVSGCSALFPVTKPSEQSDKERRVKEEELSKDRSTGGDAVGSPAGPPVTSGPLVPDIPLEKRAPRRLQWPKKKTEPTSKPSDR
ncbi:MAG: hypothetical protein AB1646_03030 [Thermodesulfobacteriota bacterium]